MSHRKFGRVSILLCSVLALAACEEGEGTGFFAATPDDTPTETTFVEREVEAPEVFQAIENGLWDGRPDFGGVWVAFPGVETPEQVIIRNEETGGFVIGALFNRERDNPGPRLIVSSDAASALGMLAGQPTPLNVTALRKEQVAVEPPAPAPVEATDDAGPEVDPEAEITAAPLEDPIAAAAAAIDRADVAAETGEAQPSDIQPAAAAPAPQPAQSSLDKPFVQIGIFSVKGNATETSNRFKKAGVVPLIKKGEIQGKPFWRVVIGPASDKAERDSLLAKARELGFTDAYAVTN